MLFFHAATNKISIEEELNNKWKKLEELDLKRGVTFDKEMKKSKYGLIPKLLLEKSSHLKLFIEGLYMFETSYRRSLFKWPEYVKHYSGAPFTKLVKTFQEKTTQGMKPSEMRLIDELLLLKKELYAFLENPNEELAAYTKIFDVFYDYFDHLKSTVAIIIGFDDLNKLQRRYNSEVIATS